MNTETWSAWSCAVAVTAQDRDLASATATVRAVMAEVDRAASRFRDDSDLSRVNAAAGRYVAVSPLTLTLLELALVVADRTQGAVTPTIGAALIAAGYDADIDTVRARTHAPSCTGGPAPAPSAVRLDRSFGRVGVTAGTRLDLGAIAKAYSVDEAVRRIGTQARGPVLVSIGGDLAVHRAPDEGWTVAVSETAHDAAEVVTIDTGALATSSTRGRRWGGGHHIIDPRTGRPAAGRVRTVSVWAPTAVEANLLSTWCLVDADEAARALEADGRPARLVTADAVVERRHGWPDAPVAVAS